MEGLNWTNQAGEVVPLRTSHPLEKENKSLKKYIVKLELEIKELRKWVGVGDANKPA